MTEAREQTATDYAPIACDLHSEYELAILHRRRLRLVWTDANVIHDEAVLPLDIHTMHHQEFLVCRAGDGAMHEIRLDRIRRMEPVE